MNKMIKYLNPAPRSIALETYPDGSVKQGYIDGSVKISSVKYITEIAFWPGGAVRAGRIDGIAEVKGITCSGFIYFYPSGKLQSCKPSESTLIKGIHFKEGQYIDFSETGLPIAGYSLKEQIIKGVKVPGDCFFIIHSSGKPQIIGINNPAEEWTSTQDGMNYACGLTQCGFTCGSYSGGGRFGEWGTSCTIREFLQGDLQDFPQSYMPEDFQTIISKAEMIHKCISEVEIYKFSVNKQQHVSAIEKGRHIKNFSWNEGYDAEYEYSIDVYDNCIEWHLRFDEQWRDAPVNAIQSIDTFLKNGPPDDFRNKRCSDEILSFIEEMKKRI